MKIDELKKELGNKNFYKLCVYGSLVLLTIIAYFIKGSNIKININWELLGFIGVIITIIYTEKSRIKQNKFDYQKEKINEEQIEFKKMLKEKVDFLNFTLLCEDFIETDSTNYEECIRKITSYRYRMMLIKDDIIWYYDRKTIKQNVELGKFMISIVDWINFYNDKMEIFCDILLKFGTEKNYKKIQDEMYEITIELNEYSINNINSLYEQAKKVVEERDNLMKDKLD